MASSDDYALGRRNELVFRRRVFDGEVGRFRAARAGYGERDIECVPGQGAMAAHAGGAQGFPQGDEASERHRRVL